MSEETAGNKKEYEYYATMISDEFINAFETLNRENIALLLALLDKKEMNFNEIKQFMGKGSSSTYNRIERLQDAALIVNKIRKEEGKRPYSFYRVSKFGKNVLKGIETTMRLTTEQMRVRENKKPYPYNFNLEETIRTFKHEDLYTSLSQSGVKWSPTSDIITQFRKQNIQTREDEKNIPQWKVKYA